MYTEQTRALCFQVSEITLVRGAGKGVIAIKLDASDTVQGFTLVNNENHGLLVSTSRGRDVLIKPKKYGASRASKGSKLLQRGTLSEWVRPMMRLDKMFQHTKSTGEMSSEETTSSTSESSVGSGHQGTALGKTYCPHSSIVSNNQRTNQYKELIGSDVEDAVPTYNHYLIRMQLKHPTTDTPSKRRKRPKIILAAMPQFHTIVLLSRVDYDLYWTKYYDSRRS